MINTLETVGSLAGHPITAEHGASTVSNRYGFISTRTLLDNLATEGFTPRSIQVARTIKEERKGFQKHIVRLNHGELMPMQLGEYRPEIVLINSHDGSTSLKLMLGMFRLVCTNGLVTGEAMFCQRFIHREISVERVNASAVSLANSLPQLADRVSAMQARQMSAVEASEFTKRAAMLRWDDEQKALQAAWSLGRSRRYEDGRDNLWQTYNRVQENIIKGGYRVRRITGAAKDVEINRSLWNLATEFLNN
jgi:hypothetical protein